MVRLMSLANLILERHRPRLDAEVVNYLQCRLKRGGRVFPDFVSVGESYSGELVVANKLRQDSQVRSRRNSDGFYLTIRMQTPVCFSWLLKECSLSIRQRLLFHGRRPWDRDARCGIWVIDETGDLCSIRALGYTGPFVIDRGFSLGNCNLPILLDGAVEYFRDHEIIPIQPVKGWTYTRTNTRS